MATALIVIDVQEEYFTGALRVAYPDPRISLSNIARAMENATRAGVPVVVVRHNGAPAEGVFVPGSPTWHLRPEVADRPRDLLVDKSHASALQDTELAAWLEERGIDTLTLAGYMTQNCVDATSRHAVVLGFQPEILADATGTLSFDTPAGKATAEELHRATLVAQRVGFARVGDTAEWVAGLQHLPRSNGASA